MKKNMEWTDTNFDHNIHGSDGIVYDLIVPVHKVSYSTIDGYKWKYMSIKCPQNFQKSDSKH